ncbi:hypothetical protein GC163_07000 [bacterium]|nr:hypothetical protein [bacterium]
MRRNGIDQAKHTRWLLLTISVGLMASIGCTRSQTRQATSSFVPWHQNSEAATQEEPVAKVTANQIDWSAQAADSAPAGVASIDDPFETAELTNAATGESASTAASPEAITQGDLNPLPYGGFESKEMAASDREAQLVSASIADPDQRIQQLKAALTADAEKQESQQLAEQQRHPLQLRAEALVSWAQHLLQLGRLNEAKRAAEQAQELSETAHLDYLPHEDRPRDLLRRIEAAMHQRQEAPQPVLGPEELATWPLDSIEPEARSQPAIMEPRIESIPEAIPIGSAESTSAESSDHTGQVMANRSALTMVPATAPEAVPANHLPPEQRVHLAAIGAGNLRDLEPLPALPPFLGEGSERPILDAETSHAMAPAPPEVAAPEPFPSIAPRKPIAIASAPQSEQSNASIRGISRTWFGAGLSIAAIFSIVGCGLLIRKASERRQTNT